MLIQVFEMIIELWKIYILQPITLNTNSIVMHPDPCTVIALPSIYSNNPAPFNAR